MTLRKLFTEFRTDIFLDMPLADLLALIVMAYVAGLLAIALAVSVIGFLAKAK